MTRLRRFSLHVTPPLGSGALTWITCHWILTPPPPHPSKRNLRWTNSAWTTFRWTRRRRRRCRTPGRSGRTAGSRKCDGKINKTGKSLYDRKTRSTCSVKKDACAWSALRSPLRGCESTYWRAEGGKKKQKQTIITPFQVQVQTRSTVKGENSELTSCRWKGQTQGLFGV